MSGWTSLDDGSLRERLAELLVAIADVNGVHRVAVDGAHCTDPDAFAASLIDALNAHGRAVAHVRASSFWHDASLRFEHGHDDEESYLSWLDAGALRREVLVPARESLTYLPSLRDPLTNRSTRENARPLESGAVLIVSGSLLLGLGLPFDTVVHLHAPADQLERDTAPDERWTLPAYARYDSVADPVGNADVVVRVGRRTLAVRGL